MTFVKGTLHLLATRNGNEIIQSAYVAEHEKKVVVEKSYFSAAAKLQKGDELTILFSGMSGSGGYTLTIHDLVVIVRYA